MCQRWCYRICTVPPFGHVLLYVSTFYFSHTSHLGRHIGCSLIQRHRRTLSRFLGELVSMSGSQLIPKRFVSKQHVALISGLPGQQRQCLDSGPQAVTLCGIPKQTRWHFGLTSFLEAAAPVAVAWSTGPFKVGCLSQFAEEFLPHHQTALSSRRQHQLPKKMTCFAATLSTTPQLLRARRGL